MSADIQHLGQKGHFFTNWAETYSCKPELYFEPESREDLRKILEHARRQEKKVRLVGNGHSPSDLACSNEYMISLCKMNTLLNIRKESCVVTVEAGILLTDLNKVLAENGLAISVLGSVSEISLAGAISTGTHGTGAQYQILSAHILELELMKADGEVITLSRDKDEALFLASCLGLGALGVILTITFQCEKAFKLHQTQYPAKVDDVLTTLDVHLRSSEHFRFVWFPHTDGAVVWHNSRSSKEIKSIKSWFWEYAIGYYLLEFLLWISTFVSWILPYINRRYYRLLFSQRIEIINRSDRVFNFNCLFKQYVNEWSIPRENTALVLKQIQAWIENNNFPAHFPIEVRFVKKDDILLSPAYGRDSCYINIIMYRPYTKTVAHEKYWKAFEQIMAEADGRPHWAKDHHVTKEEFQKMYPKWDTFCAIRQKLDPRGRFLNANLERFF